MPSTATETALALATNPARKQTILDWMQRRGFQVDDIKFSAPGHLIVSSGDKKGPIRCDERLRVRSDDERFRLSPLRNVDVELTPDTLPLELR